MTLKQKQKKHYTTVSEWEGVRVHNPSVKRKKYTNKDAIDAVEQSKKEEFYNWSDTEGDDKVAE